MFDIKCPWKALTQLYIPPPKQLLLCKATLSCSSAFHQNWNLILMLLILCPPLHVSLGQWPAAACVLQAEGWCPPDPVPVPLPQHSSAPRQWMVVAQGFGRSSGFWRPKAYAEDAIYS